MTSGPSATAHGSPPGPRAAPQAREDARNLESSLRDPERFGLIFDRYLAEIHRYIARRLFSFEIFQKAHWTNASPRPPPTTAEARRTVRDSR